MAYTFTSQAYRYNWNQFCKWIHKKYRCVTKQLSSENSLSKKEMTLTKLAATTEKLPKLNIGNPPTINTSS